MFTTPRRWKAGDKFSASHLNETLDLAAAAAPLQTGHSGVEIVQGRSGTGINLRQMGHLPLIRVKAVAPLDQPGFYSGKKAIWKNRIDPSAAITGWYDLIDFPEDVNCVLMVGNDIGTDGSSDLALDKIYIAVPLNMATPDGAPVLEIIEHLVFLVDVTTDGGDGTVPADFTYGFTLGGVTFATVTPVNQRPDCNMIAGTHAMYDLGQDKLAIIDEVPDYRECSNTLGGYGLT